MNKVLYALLITLLTITGCSRSSEEPKTEETIINAPIENESKPDNSISQVNNIIDEDTANFLMDINDQFILLMKLYIEIGNNEDLLTSIEVDNQFSQIANTLFPLLDEYYEIVSPNLPQNELTELYDELLIEGVNGLELFQDAIHFDDFDSYKKANEPLTNTGSLIKEWANLYVESLE